MQFLARGKRGDVFLTRFRGRIVAVKCERKESTAINRLVNEASWLRTLNKKGIGPRFLALRNNHLFMEYIRGEPFGKYLERKPLSKALVKEILLQCRILDQMHVNKLEMHHPVKHVLIRKGKITLKNVVMIDFERCKHTLQPKNVTQFCQYLLKLHWSTTRERLLPFLQTYKQQQDSRSFRRLLRVLLS